MKSLKNRITAFILTIVMCFTFGSTVYFQEEVYAVAPVTLAIEEAIAWLLMTVGIYDNSGNSVSESPLYQRDNLVYQVQNSVYGQQSEYVQSGAFASALDDMIDSAVNGVNGAIRVNEFLWETIKEWSSELFSEALSDDTFVDTSSTAFQDWVILIERYENKSNFKSSLMLSLDCPDYTIYELFVYNQNSHSETFSWGVEDGYLVVYDSSYSNPQRPSVVITLSVYNDGTLKSGYSDVNMNLWSYIGIDTDYKIYSNYESFKDGYLPVSESLSMSALVSIPWITGNLLLKDGYDLVTKGRTKADNGSLVGDVAITIPATKSISNIIEGLRAKESADEDTYIPWVDAVTSVGAYPVSIADDTVVTGTKTDEDEKEVPVVTPVGEWLEVLEKAEIEEPTTEEENTEDLNDIPLDNITVPYVPAQTGEYLENLKKKFPFCIPFDIVSFFQHFKDEQYQAIAPTFHWEVQMPGINYVWVIDIDLSDYWEYVKLFRGGVLILFSIGLIFSTRKLIAWQLLE